MKILVQTCSFKTSLILWLKELIFTQSTVKIILRLCQGKGAHFQWNVVFKTGVFTMKMLTCSSL